MNHFSRLSALLSTTAVVSLPGFAYAVPLESVYPVASENYHPVCYMEQTSGSTLDLTRICASTSISSPIRSSSASNRSSFSLDEPDTSGKSVFPIVTESYSPPRDSSGESASTQIERARLDAQQALFGKTRFAPSNYDDAANCSTPDDITANGYRCGDRAASVRLGG